MKKYGWAVSGVVGLLLTACSAQLEVANDSGTDVDAAASDAAITSPDANTTDGGTVDAEVVDADASDVDANNDALDASLDAAFDASAPFDAATSIDASLEVDAATSVDAGPPPTTLSYDDLATALARELCENPLCNFNYHHLLVTAALTGNLSGEACIARATAPMRHYVGYFAKQVELGRFTYDGERALSCMNDEAFTCQSFYPTEVFGLDVLPKLPCGFVPALPVGSECVSTEYPFFGRNGGPIGPCAGADTLCLAGTEGSFCTLSAAQPGDPCERTSDCAWSAGTRAECRIEAGPGSGRCYAITTYPVGSGDSCDEMVDGYLVFAPYCTPGLGYPTTGPCTCVALPANEGDECDPAFGCDYSSSLSCIFDGSSSYTCSSFAGGEGLAPEGGACNSESECVDGLYCRADAIGEVGECSYVELVETEGASCAPKGFSKDTRRICDLSRGLFCVRQDMSTYTCRAYTDGRDGSACSMWREGMAFTPLCASGYECRLLPGTSGGGEVYGRGGVCTPITP